MQRQRSIADGFLRVRVAGITCTDWSVRGLRAGTLGKSALAFAAFMWECFHDDGVDAILVECTSQYRHADIERILGQNFELSDAVFSVTELGIPTERWRKYMVLLRIGGRLRWQKGHQFSRQRLLEVFGRRLVCNGHVYMDSTAKEVTRPYADWLARRRGFPERDHEGKRWAFRTLTSKKTRDRIDAHLEYASRRGMSTDVMFDAMRNLGYGNMSSSAPALLQRNLPWSTKYDRPLVPEERLEAQGFPTIDPERTLGLAFPWPSALAALGPAQLNSLAGNSMHFAAICSVLLYVLAFAEVES